jgi:hypothetical protein
MMDLTLKDHIHLHYQIITKKIILNKEFKIVKTINKK